MVLRAPLRGSGLVVLLDQAEVIPAAPCPTCRSARQRDWDISCWRCGDTETIGIPMVGFGAAVAEDGTAVPLDLSRLTTRDEYGKHGDWLGLRIVEPGFEGHAIHRAHRC